MEVAGPVSNAVRAKDEKLDATLCSASSIHSYTQAQSRLEVFALVESNREG
jgi:hypothetical protein